MQLIVEVADALVLEESVARHAGRAGEGVAVAGGAGRLAGHAGHWNQAGWLGVVVVDEHGRLHTDVAAHAAEAECEADACFAPR